MTDREEQPTPRPRRLDRRTFLAGGLRVGGALTAAALGAEAIVAGSAPAHKTRVGPYRRTRQPNILVVIVDQLRTPRWYGPGSGAGAVLPDAVAALAREGVSFERHYTASNDCTPARAAMLTGLHTHQTGCMITGGSTLDPQFPTWGRMLGEQGYRSWWYGKWHLTRGDRGWTEGTGRAALQRYGFEGGTFPSPNGAPGQGWRVDPLIADQFDQWFHGDWGSGPWCTTVSFVNPHDIAWWWRWSKRFPTEATPARSVFSLPPNFETPAQLEARGKPSVQRSLQDTTATSAGAVPFEGPGVTQAWLGFLDLYVSLQREVNRSITRVLATLASRPSVMENTIVVFTSDHGEYGGSHGLRGKGAGMYEEAIRVPLVLADFSSRLSLTPGTRREQVTSSVDLAPLLLTLGTGSGEWRADPRYAQLSGRADLLDIAQHPDAPGREYALHATDEVITEFAVLPHAAHAPLHVTGIITPTHKYASYSHWRDRTFAPISGSEEHELYDFTTPGGKLEIENLAGRSPEHERLHHTLEHAILHELHAPLPFPLVTPQERSFHRYHTLAAAERTVSETHRLHAVERAVRQVERHLP